MIHSTLCLKMDTNFRDTFELNSTEHKHLRVLAPQFTSISIDKNQITGRINVFDLSDESDISLKTKFKRKIPVKATLVYKPEEGGLEYFMILLNRLPTSTLMSFLTW